MPSQSFGRYELVELLAVGGMGEVFVAVDHGSPGATSAYHKPCVVKRILPDLANNAEAAAMFAREAAFATQLSHANIVQVFDHGAIDGRAYTAMEFVHGTSLKTLLDIHARAQVAPPLEVVVHVLHSTAAALAYAHARMGWDGQPLNLVHRDVSPQNILLSLDGEVKLADFGMVKGASVRGVYQTAETTLRGKFRYMSPEQATGAAVDQRSDLFSLGTVLYELVALRHPFAEGVEGLHLLDRIKRAEHVPLADARPGIPQALVDIIEGCLQRDPGDRPASARVLLQSAEDVRATLFPRASNLGLAAHMAHLPIPPLPRPFQEALAAPGQRITRESQRPVTQPPRSRTRDAVAPIARTVVAAAPGPVLVAGAGAEASAFQDEPLPSFRGPFHGPWPAVGLLTLAAAGGATWAYVQGRADAVPPAVVVLPDPGLARPDAGDTPPPSREARAPRVPVNRRQDLREVVERTVAADNPPTGIDSGSRPPPAQVAAPPTVPVTALPLLNPPDSPGFPPRSGGVRFNAQRPVRVLKDGVQEAEALQGFLSLDQGIHTLQFVLRGGAALSVRVEPGAGEKTAHITAPAGATVQFDQATLSGTAARTLRPQGSLVTLVTAEDALSVTLR